MAIEFRSLSAMLYENWEKQPRPRFEARPAMLLARHQFSTAEISRPSSCVIVATVEHEVH